MSFDTDIKRFTLDSDPRKKVSANFSIYELYKSDIAERSGIDNRFQTEEELHSAINFTRNILQPVRNAWGRFSPNSVYRGQELERKLKHQPRRWTSKSQHPKGEAGDFEVCRVSNIDLAKWCVSHLDFDQIILECYDPDVGENSGWVHASYKDDGSNRNQVLSYVKIDGHYTYVNGISADRG